MQEMQTADNHVNYFLLKTEKEIKTDGLLDKSPQEADNGRQNRKPTLLSGSIKNICGVSNACRDL
uniref:Bm1191 n=1 Tax=Brugia malayi TaxID=6279 RepID=A0A1I9G6G6_BRUMA|nr:Bm1191 [Brugia malayi]